MSDPKKPDESKKDAAASEEQGELNAEDLDKVAGGVLNVGAFKTGNATAVKLTPVRIDPEIPPKGGGLE